MSSFEPMDFHRVGEGPTAPPTLPIHIQPYNDEGLHGFLLRAAEENIYDRYYWITDLGGILSKIIKSEFLLLGHHVETLSQILGCDADRLSEMSYAGSIYSGEQVICGFGEERLPASAIEYLTPKVCPECLREEPYIRQHWDLSLLAVCPHHGSKMMNTCPDCGKPITWNRGYVEGCDCGGDFTFAETEQASDVATSMAKVVYNSLPSHRTKFEVDGRYPEVVYNMSYVTIGKVCAYLDGLSHDAMVSPPQLHRAALELRYDVLEECAQVLTDWPKNWHALIQKRLDEHAFNPQSGVQKTFGKMYQHLYARENDGDFDFLREEFAKYLNDSEYALRIMRKGGARLLELSLIEFPCMTAEEARIKIDCSKGKLNNLIRSGQLDEVIVPEISLQARRITKASVERYLARTNGKMISPRELSDFVRISLPSIMKLLESGAISSSRGTGATGREPWLIHSDDAIEFRLKLNAHVETCSMKNTAWLMTYPEAISKLNAAGVTIDDLITALVDGKIQGFRTTDFPSALNEMFFDQAVLNQYLQRRLN